MSKASDYAELAKDYRRRLGESPLPPYFKADTIGHGDPVKASIDDSGDLLLRGCRIAVADVPAFLAWVREMYAEHR